MSTFDTASWLSSIVDHINHHPHLGATISNLHGYERRLQLLDTCGSELRSLAEWARSLGSVDEVAITARSEYTHLNVVGRLADDSSVRITALLDEAEADLLASHTELKVGATFPVDLLFQIDSKAVTA